MSKVCGASRVMQNCIGDDDEEAVPKIFELALARKSITCGNGIFLESSNGLRARGSAEAVSAVLLTELRPTLGALQF